MSYEMLTSPVELTDAELDAIAGGNHRPDTGDTNQEGVVNVDADVVVKNVFVAVQALTSNSRITRA